MADDNSDSENDGSNMGDTGLGTLCHSNDSCVHRDSSNTAAGRNCDVTPY